MIFGIKHQDGNTLICVNSKWFKLTDAFYRNIACMMAMALGLMMAHCLVG